MVGSLVVFVFTQQAHPAGQHRMGLLDTQALGRREQLHAGHLAPALTDVLLHLEQGVLRRAVGELVGLGQQDVHGQAAGQRPVEHQAVELGQRMADVHQQDHADQAVAAAQVGLEVALPVLLERDRYLGVAVAGQVDQAALVVETEEVEQLGPPRGLRGTRQTGVGQGVHRAGLAGVGAPGEGHLVTHVRRTLVDLRGALDEGGLLTQTEDGILDGHGVGLLCACAGNALQAGTGVGCDQVSRMAVPFPF
ncbi:hypothetical protein D3C75_675860 [compost metagenome]